MKYNSVKVRADCEHARAHTPGQHTSHKGLRALQNFVERHAAKQTTFVAQSNHPSFIKLAAMAFAHAVLLASAVWCNSVQLVGKSLFAASTANEG
jgi:hypothetical protein